MDAKRYRQIRQLFDAVQEQRPEERSAYLTAAAQGDPALRDEVQRLLVASDSGTEVFERPAVIRDGPGLLHRWEGRRLGPYQILRELGEGGMGIVYLARRADGAFQKEVAIKIVRRQLATASFFQRFQRERDILARLEHPHIARLLDGGISPPYLVMEYVKGEPLLVFADSRRLPFDDRLALLRQIASAVDYAHRQGVIHRDLKPGNIFVTSDGEVKLLDFGIAAWQQGPSESELTPTIAMSPAYASPEQVRGDKTNQSTDIYSLGLVAYELLAGTPAFRMEEAAWEEVLRTILERIPPAPSVAVRESKTPGPADLGKLRQMAPIELIERLEKADAPLLRAMSKRREDRPASAAVLIAELEGGAQRPTALPWWMESIVRQWDYLALQACFLAFAASGELRLSPVAWVAYAWASGMILLGRSGYLARLYALNSTLVIAGGAYSLAFAAALAAGSRQEVARRINSGLVIPVGFLLFDILRYYLRRASALGDVLVSSRSRNFGPAWAVLFLAATGWFAVECFAGNANRILATTMFALAFWFCWKVSLKPLEVRERGMVVPSALLSWSAIKDYCWLKPTTLELRLHATILPSVAYVRAEVAAEDHERVQAILQNWLSEAPDKIRPR